MLSISKCMETLTLKGDRLETNLKGFCQKGLNKKCWSPMETLLNMNIACDATHSVFELQSTLRAIVKWTYRVLCKSNFTWFTEYSVKHPKIDIQSTLYVHFTIAHRVLCNSNIAHFTEYSVTVIFVC